jgi:hypothetical protein
MPVLTTHPIRDQLLSLLGEQRSDEFLLRSEAYLDVVEQDHEIRLRTVQEYLKRGLLDPARDHLNSALVYTSAPSDMADLRPQLMQLPRGVRPWRLYTDRFEANLSSLDARGIDTSSIRDAWRSRSGQFELHVDSANTEYVRWRRDKGWSWIPFFGNHRLIDQNRPLPEDIKSTQPGPYAFDGLDLGYYFERIYEATTDTFLGYSGPIFVVEPDPAQLAMLFHMHDWTKLLADRRVHLYFGTDCMHQFCRSIDSNPNLPLPRIAFRISNFRPPCTPSLPETIKQVSQEVERRIIESFAEVEARYANCDVGYWADRFEEALSGNGRPLRILATVSTHTSFLKYSLRDAQKALESLGHECLVFTESTNYEYISPLCFHEHIKRFEPDLMFILDHLRPEFAYILPSGLPLLTWDQDQLPHVFTKNNVAGISSIDFLAGFAVQRCLALGTQPAQLLPAVIPTCPTQFSNESLTDQDLEPYRCDVSYVSHTSQTPKEFHDEERKQFTNQSLLRLLDKLYELLPEYLARDVAPHFGIFKLVLNLAQEQCGIASISDELNQRLLAWYLWRLADRIFRHESLEWVAKWAEQSGRTLRIYGNGWDKHPTLARFAVGPAENGHELLCVYNATRINLQLMPAGFIHQRALDGLAAGGFFLTRLTHGERVAGALRALGTYLKTAQPRCNAELLDVVDPNIQSLLDEFLGLYRRGIDPNDKDLIVNIRSSAGLLQSGEAFPHFDEIVFDSAGNFAEKADRFLEDADRRLEIAAQMRTTVIERFSYESTMNEFLHAHAKCLRSLACKSNAPDDGHKGSSQKEVWHGPSARESTGKMPVPYSSGTGSKSEPHAS